MSIKQAGYELDAKAGSILTIPVRQLTESSAIDLRLSGLSDSVGLKSVQSKIENVVATANLGQHLDLDSILKVTSGAKYNPQQFPGLLYKLKRPKTSTLLFASGKMVCTGAVSARSAERAIARIITELRADGIVILKMPDVRIENIVATGDLGNRIDLENVAERLVKTIYEPEQFAGLIYRMEEPKVVFLLFTSGKFVCTGAKTRADVNLAVEKLRKNLHANKLVL
ncbi:MAG: TATA-box-binding protein [Candidatus Bathyarchaeia archaeon]